MIHQFLNLFAVYKIKKKKPTHRPSVYYHVSVLLGNVVHLTKLQLDQGSIQWDAHSLDSVLTLLHGRENEKAVPLISFV